MHASAVSRHRRQNIRAVLNDAGIDKMLVKVIDIFGHAVLQRSGDGDEIKNRKVLDEFAESNTASVGTHGHIELLRHEVDGEDLVDAGQPRRIELAEIDGFGLNNTRFIPCSPVATPIGATARRIAAWPSTSSGLVGSSIHIGRNCERAFTHSIASGTSQTWFASIIRFAS
jgi:hypothetical protein